jgi:hypothetical protein
MQKKLQDPFVASVDKAVTKRVNARAVSRSASWQWACVELPDGKVQAMPDFVGRASAAERRTEFFVTQRKMKAIQRSLFHSVDQDGRHVNLTSVVKDTNGNQLFGILETELGFEHPQAGALKMLTFAGTDCVAAVTTFGQKWLKHRGIFKKQAVRREAVKALFGFAGKTTARKTAFDKYLAN